MGENVNNNNDFFKSNNDACSKDGYFSRNDQENNKCDPISKVNEN